jgi:tetratricopeptide (TPR) repeat protein
LNAADFLLPPKSFTRESILPGRQVSRVVIRSKRFGSESNEYALIIKVDQDKIDPSLRAAYTWLEARGMIVPAHGTNGQKRWRRLNRRARRFRIVTEFTQYPATLMFGLSILLASSSTSLSYPNLRPPLGNAAGDDNLNAAIHLVQQGRFQEAESRLHEAIVRDPSSAEAYFYLGIATIQLGRPADAEGYLRRSLQLNPNSIDAQYNLGVLLLEEGKPAQGVVQLESADRAGPPTPEISVNLVRAYLEAHQRDRALQFAASASRQFHNSAPFQLALGQCFRNHGMTEQAIGALQAANQLAPNQPEVVLPLAAAYLQRKDANQALAVLDTIAAADGENFEYHRMRAAADAVADRRENALAEIGRAVELAPNDPGCLLAKASYEQKYGYQQKAVATLEKAQRLAPDSSEIPYRIALSYFAADDFDTAARSLNRALDLQPRDHRAIFLLALIELSQMKLAAADKDLRRAVELQPRNPYYHCFLGMTMVSSGESRGQYAEAQQEFDRSIQLSPSYALPHYQLGRLLNREHDYTGAKRELEAAVSLQAEFSEAYFQLAHTYSKLGEAEKAKAALAEFQRYHGGEFSVREELLKQAHQQAQGEP